MGPEPHAFSFGKEAKRGKKMQSRYDLDGGVGQNPTTLKKRRHLLKSRPIRKGVSAGRRLTSLRGRPGKRILIEKSFHSWRGP